MVDVLQDVRKIVSHNRCLYPIRCKHIGDKGKTAMNTIEFAVLNFLKTFLFTRVFVSKKSNHFSLQLLGICASSSTEEA